MAFDPTTVKPGTGFDPTKVQRGDTQPARTADPTDTESEAAAFEQGAIFDPIEAVGQMLPESVSGAISRVIPEGVKRYAAESKAGAEQHPYWETAGNIAPWLLVPGGESALADIAIGAGSSLLQPVDPSTENFWSRKVAQAGLGGGTAWGLGKIARGISERLDAARRAQTQYAADVNAANAAHLKAWGERNLANRDALAAHAAAATEQAKQTGYALSDHLDAVAAQHRAITSHLDAVSSRAEEAARAHKQYLADLDEHVATTGRLRAEYDQRLAEHKTQMDARNTLNQRENVNWMRRAMNRVGLGAETPRTAGDRELNFVRGRIGDKLNEANAQLSFDPTTTDAIGRIQQFRDAALPMLGEDNQRLWNNLIDRKVLNGIAERQQVRQPGLTPEPGLEQPEAKWVARSALQGQDFAKYVTMLNQEADNLARNAKFPGRNTADDLEMASALHAMSDFVEGAARGPAKAIKERDAAREGYRIYSTLRSAADPTKLSVARPEQVVAEIERRAGNAERYGQKLAEPGAPGHVDAAHAERWLKQSLEPEPEAPKLTLPKAPEEPTVGKAPELPTKATKEPALPKIAGAPPPPKPAPLPKRPTYPSPPEELGPSRVARSLAHLGLHALGVPPLVSTPLSHVAARAARGPGKIARTAKWLGRHPGVVGATAGGNVPTPDIDILSIVPGGP